MTNHSKMTRILSLSLVVAGFVFLSGSLTNTNAQTRDPFAKPGWAKPRTVSTGTSSPSSSGSGTVKVAKPKPAGPPPIIALGAPPIEQRISYYKQLREAAATNGEEIPKVTSVLTLEEMSVMGIFRTPRGVAAMVEAKPIKLSYTIYPGEKFFDGQLVAIEENRLVFRKIIKMSNGKFVASVENKALRQYSVQEEIQGTAPVETSAPKTETAAAAPPTEQPAEGVVKTVVAPSLIISPLEEMNKQPLEQPKDSAKEKPGKKSKKPVKVARNRK